MAKFQKLDKRGNQPDYYFDCPGCKCSHGVWTTESNDRNAVWRWNNDVNKPTVSPSLRVSFGNGKICHSFIKDGKIQFLNDCTHHLAGQTVELPEI